MGLMIAGRRFGASVPSICFSVVHHCWGGSKKVAVTLVFGVVERLGCAIWLTLGETFDRRKIA